jgi:alkylhydroperoxidase/carboxymuconolactone decarboxylase family protein YurZ
MSQPTPTKPTRGNGPAPVTARPASADTTQEAKSRPVELLKILPKAAVERLRKSYDRNALTFIAKVMIGYPKAGGLAQWIGDVVYNDTPDGRDTTTVTSLSPAQREMVIIATVAAERDTFVLSGHLYWGLMEGLSVENLADVLLTVAAYSGVNNFRLSRQVLEDVLEELDAADQEAASTKGTQRSTIDVIRRLKKKFPDR